MTSCSNFKRIFEVILSEKFYIAIGTTLKIYRPTGRESSDDLNMTNIFIVTRNEAYWLYIISHVPPWKSRELGPSDHS